MKRPVLRHRAHHGLIAFLIAILTFSPVLSATEHYGQVGFTGLAVPGATVTATQGVKQIVTTTDQSGLYRFPDLAEGTWTIKIEMRGFAPLSREVNVIAGAQAAVWELSLLSFEEITKGFGGDVGIVPRQFLRSLVNRFDVVVDNPKALGKDVLAAR